MCFLLLPVISRITAGSHIPLKNASDLIPNIQHFVPCTISVEVQVNIY